MRIILNKRDEVGMRVIRPKFIPLSSLIQNVIKKMSIGKSKKKIREGKLKTSLN